MPMFSFSAELFKGANIKIDGLRLELLDPQRRAQAVGMLVEAFSGKGKEERKESREHFRKILRRQNVYEHVQCITLVDDSMGIVALALIETMRDGNARKKPFVYLHAFVVREDMRARDLKLGTRFVGALVNLCAFQDYEAIIFTATTGARASMGFWISNLAFAIKPNDDKAYKVPKRLAKLYNVQAPVFTVDQTTPPMGLLIDPELRPKTWDDLETRLLELCAPFGADVRACLRAMRNGFPLRRPPSIQPGQGEALMVTEHRVDPEGRTRSAARKAAGETVQRPDYNEDRIARTHEIPTPQQPCHHVWLVDGRRARLLTRDEFQEHLFLLGWSMRRTRQGRTAYVVPSSLESRGIGFLSLETAAHYVGTPKTICGRFIVVSQHTVVPRFSDIHLLPDDAQQHILDANLHALVAVASCSSQKTCIFCDKYPAEVGGGWVGCGGYPSDDPHGACFNGCHVRCLHFYSRHYTRQSKYKRPGAIFCSERCRAQGLRRDLRIDAHPDHGDIIMTALLVNGYDPYMISTLMEGRTMTRRDMELLAHAHHVRGLDASHLPPAYKEGKQRVGWSPPRRKRPRHGPPSERQLQRLMEINPKYKDHHHAQFRGVPETKAGDDSDDSDAPDETSCAFCPAVRNGTSWSTFVPPGIKVGGRDGADGAAANETSMPPWALDPDKHPLPTRPLDERHGRLYDVLRAGPIDTRRPRLEQLTVVDTADGEQPDDDDAPTEQSDDEARPSQEQQPSDEQQQQQGTTAEELRRELDEVMGDATNAAAGASTEPEKPPPPPAPKARFCRRVRFAPDPVVLSAVGTDVDEQHAEANTDSSSSSPRPPSQQQQPRPHEPVQLHGSTTRRRGPRDPKEVQAARESEELRLAFDLTIGRGSEPQPNDEGESDDEGDDDVILPPDEQTRDNDADERARPNKKPRAPPAVWSTEELDKLLDAVDKHGRTWALVAEAVGTKTRQQCCNCWRRASKKLERLKRQRAEAKASRARPTVTLVPLPPKKKKKKKKGVTVDLTKTKKTKTKKKKKAKAGDEAKADSKDDDAAADASDGADARTEKEQRLRRRKIKKLRRFHRGQLKLEKERRRYFKKFLNLNKIKTEVDVWTLGRNAKFGLPVLQRDLGPIIDSFFKCRRRRSPYWEKPDSPDEQYVDWQSRRRRECDIYGNYFGRQDRTERGYFNALCVMVRHFVAADGSYTPRTDDDDPEFSDDECCVAPDWPKLPVADYTIDKDFHFSKSTNTGRTTPLLTDDEVREIKEETARKEPDPGPSIDEIVPSRRKAWDDYLASAPRFASGAKAGQIKFCTFVDSRGYGASSKKNWALALQYTTIEAARRRLEPWSHDTNVATVLQLTAPGSDPTLEQVRDLVGGVFVLEPMSRLVFRACAMHHGSYARCVRDVSKIKKCKFPAFNGVYWDRKIQKWVVYVFYKENCKTVNGKKVYPGPREDGLPNHPVLPNGPLSEILIFLEPMLREKGLIPNMPRTVLEALQIMIAILGWNHNINPNGRGGNKSLAGLTDRYIGSDQDGTFKELGFASRDHMCCLKWPRYHFKWHARRTDTLLEARFYQMDLIIYYCRLTRTRVPFVAASLSLDSTRNRHTYLLGISPFDKRIKKRISRARVLWMRYRLLFFFKRARQLLNLEKKFFRLEGRKGGLLNRCIQVDAAAAAAAALKPTPLRRNRGAYRVNLNKSKKKAWKVKKPSKKQSKKSSKKSSAASASSSAA